MPRFYIFFLRVALVLASRSYLLISTSHIVSLTLLLLCVYSARRFVLCLALCYFVLVFFNPFSIVITSIGEESASLGAFRTFVRFALVWFCLFPLPLGVWEGLRFVIVALFSYPLFLQDRFCGQSSLVLILQHSCKWYLLRNFPPSPHIPTSTFFFFFFFFFFFCVEVLRPSQPNGVMSSAVS